MNTRQHTNSRRQETEHYSLLVTKTAPRLEYASLAAKVQFLKEWEVYEDDIEAHCRRTGDTVARVKETMKGSIKKIMLQFWCRNKWKIDCDTITDDVILEKLQSEVSTLDKDKIANIKPTFKKQLKIDLKESDVEARVVEYFLLGQKITEDNGWTECFNTAKGKRKYCKILVKHLEPVELRELVEEQIEFHNQEAVDDPDLLFDTVLCQAKIQNVSFLAQQKHRERKRKNDVENQSEQKSKKLKIFKPQNDSKGGKRMSPPTERKDNNGKEKTFSFGKTCFHCKGDHKLKDCPIATTEDKNKIWEKRKNTYRKESHVPK